MAEPHYETGEIQSVNGDMRAEYSYEERERYTRRTEEYNERRHDRQRSISPSATLSPSRSYRDYPRRSRSRSRVSSRSRDYSRDRSRSRDRYRHHRSRRDHYSRHDDRSGHYLDAQEFEDRPRRSRYRHHRRSSTEYPPSEQVRVYGIPPDMTADELKYTLEQMGAVLESANLSHNRDHDPSIGVAFAQFVSHGRDIVVGNYTASLKYWRSSRREDWECQQCHLINFHHRRECYMCGIPRQAFKQSLNLLNDGTRDIGTTLHHTLLIRNLDPLCDEEHIYGSVLMATDKVTTPLRVLLVRDRTTRRSCSYAFVEFADNTASIYCCHLLLLLLLDSTTDG
ncbi:hypothetical protein BDF22DRAFT_677372 [Syncephalis plumigaleata]|nr:hypothetical protein BDF22DRAFT_677372 [Syncephalis plumigaleata]